MAALPWIGEILSDSRSYFYMRRKLRQGMQNSKPDNVGVRPLKCTTSITYQVMVIFIISMGLIGKATSFELHTERSVKVERGRNASLICSFTDPADAVYWYKHNSTGAPVDDADLVAREYLGKSDPLPGKERFRITEDYRLLISDVSIADETTYSCLVVLQTSLIKRGYTDLKIIVLADSLGLRIRPCNTLVPGECTYNVPTDPPEEVVFVCEVGDVRPPVNLTWVRSDGKVMKQALGPRIDEKNGLYNVTSILKIPKSGFDYFYSCQATGDAVHNASSTKVTFVEGTVPDGSGSVSRLAVASYFFSALFIMISIVMVILICRRYYSLSRAGVIPTTRYRQTVKVVKTDPESGHLEKEDGEQGEYEKNEITLKRSVEELEQERDRDKAKFEEEQRLMEFNLERSGDFVEVLTQENRSLRKAVIAAGFQVQSTKRNVNSEKGSSVLRSIPRTPWIISEKKIESGQSIDAYVDDYCDSVELTELRSNGNMVSMVRWLQHLLVIPPLAIKQSFCLLRRYFVAREAKKEIRFQESEQTKALSVA